MSNTEQFTIPAVIAFPSLYQPSAPKDTNAEPRYNTTLVITSETYTQFILPKLEALVAKDFTNGESALPGFKWGFLPCTMKPKTYPADLTPGMFYANAKSADQQEVVDQQRQPILEPNTIRNGAIVYISINLYSYTKAGNVGVGIGLGAVMLMGAGPALNVGGGAVSAKDAFEGIAVTDAAPTPSGAIPVSVAGAVPSGISTPDQ